MTGEDVLAVRRQLGLTQERFARRLDVTVSTVNRWENGHAAPSALAARAIQALVADERGTHGEG